MNRPVGSRQAASVLGGVLFAVIASATVFAAPQGAVGSAQSEAASAAAQQQTSTPAPGTFVPGTGFTLVNGEDAQLVFRAYGDLRYLNQLALDGTSTDAFGQARPVRRRQDMQLNTIQLYFLGWMFSERFRYLTYVWSANTSQGLTAQVVVAGNVTYRFDDHLTAGFGVSSLPGTRSLEGTFPFWLSVNNRLIADEFFRPSYTTGIFANGKIAGRLTYQVMLGNNLSQLGIDAGQLDNRMDTLATAVVWMPTTGEFGRSERNGFGDFEDHDKVATRLGAHFTRSNENRQSSPNTDAFDNVQIRLSDGSVVFRPDLFGEGITINDVRYRMASMDAGLKYHGLSFSAEYYHRWLDEFDGVGTSALPFDVLEDHGFQAIGSAMLRPKTLQIYAGGSKVYGGFGDPWSARGGVNWYPWKNQWARWNAEAIYLRRSPVGALSLPYVVGGNGPVFDANLEFYF